MHVGNLRVAIFNHLFTRHHGGTFVVRIEDTDVERNLEGSLDSLLEDLRWAGVGWDEGPRVGGPFGPYIQSERRARHVERAEQLRDRGLAYRCFCPAEEIEAPKAGSSEFPRCPGRCRDLAPAEAEATERKEGTPATIRFAVPSEGALIVDHIRGSIEFSVKDIEDFIILRSDGRATYNFAVVVDDLDMQITHVIRGAGHLSNTPKQALLFDALGAVRPVYAHLPTVLGPDGSKLSKRTGAPGIDSLRAEGFHPDAVTNYLSLLGWSPGDDREVMSRDELIDALDLDRIGSSNTVYDPEKLRWMSAQHLARLSIGDLATAVRPYIDQDRFPLRDLDLALVLEAVRSRLQTLGDINSALLTLFPEPHTFDSAFEELGTAQDEPLLVLRTVQARVRNLDPWTAEATASAVRQAGKDIEVRGARLFHPIRLAICGARSGPDLGKVLAALGRDEAIKRLDAAVDKAGSHK